MPWTSKDRSAAVLARKEAIEEVMKTGASSAAYVCKECIGVFRNIVEDICMILFMFWAFSLDGPDLKEVKEWLLMTATLIGFEEAR